MKLASQGEQFTVILSDIPMPGMGGEGAFDWVRTHHPERAARILFTSGDLLLPRTQTFLEAAGRPMLAKPFTLAALRTALAPLGR